MTVKDYQILNREAWQKFAEEYKEPAEKAWKSGDPHWGIWQLPESKLELFPNDLKGKKCIEIGCGAGYVSSWMARRGAEVIGIDPTPNQLETRGSKGIKTRISISIHDKSCFCYLLYAR